MATQASLSTADDFKIALSLIDSEVGKARCSGESKATTQNFHEQMDAP